MLTAAAFVLSGALSAQGQFPTEYTLCIGIGETTSNDIRGIWDEVVQGKPGQGSGLVAPSATKPTPCCMTWASCNEPSWATTASV